MIQKILVAGGGTGGHLFPGIAVVEELRRRKPELEVLFVGTDRGLEQRVLGALGERFVALEVKPLLGQSRVGLLRNLVSLPASALTALSLLRSFRPDLVIGLGGYVSGPVLLAAAGMRVPTVLLEQNAHVGLTNRWLAKTVGRAYLTYEETIATFGAQRARVLGNPIRRAFVDAARRAGHDPMGVDARARNVLVLGGSQGARSLNQQIPEVLARAGVVDRGLRIVHQCGEAGVESVTRRYAELGVEAEVTPFIDDVARAMIDAALVIGRAGATTLAELCAVGRPAVLIPLPTAAEDHQAQNAFALERAGAALAVREADLNVERLAGEVRDLCDDSERRRAMAAAARRRGRPDAAAAIVDDLFEWLGVHDGSAPTGESPAPGESDGIDPGTAVEAQAPARPVVRRRSPVKRRELRLRPVGASLGAAPEPVYPAAGGTILALAREDRA
ncbi:MAG: undecaprenyldiphospho-muramoylpentapeptide beta-N-acetylglucosaminyltransferase [Myxococcales bacterium]|nr:undecaprenyldiphospho-muramoylpentapeptide beta-N-acetylglucosaminyltransferase [Myxococcales bacterium]